MPGMVVELTLYVTGGSHRSARALRNLRELLEASDAGVDLEVVDVIEHPERAGDDRIVTTPTLLRRTPSLRVIGDLSVPEAVGRLLD